MTAQGELLLRSGVPWALSEPGLASLVAALEHPAPAKPGSTPAPVPIIAQSRVVVVIGVDGPLLARRSGLSDAFGLMTMDTLRARIGKAILDPSIAGLVLDVSSPGGEAHGPGETSDLVHSLRGRKPVVAYVGSIAASGAYWIASAADRVVMDATALVGSIGLAARYVRTTPQAGSTVTEIVSSQSPNKRLDPASDAGRGEVQRQLDAMAQVFVEAVARNRGVTTAHVLEHFGRGGLEVGAAAVAVGMADQLGSLQDAINLAAGGLPARTISARKPIVQNPAVSQPATLAAQIQSEWNSQPDIRSEFMNNFGAYSAFRTAEAAGRVSYHGTGRTVRTRSD